MNTDLIQRQADHHLTDLRRPRVATHADVAVNRFRHAVARALRTQALRVESLVAAETPST